MLQAGAPTGMPPDRIAGAQSSLGSPARRGSGLGRRRLQVQGRAAHAASREPRRWLSRPQTKVLRDHRAQTRTSQAGAPTGTEAEGRAVRGRTSSGASGEGGEAGSRGKRRCRDRSVRVGTLMRASPRVERRRDEGFGKAGLPVGTVPADLWRTPAGSVLQYVRDPDPGANRRGVEKARGRNVIDRLATVGRRASAREWTGQGMSAEGRMKAPC